MAFFEDLGKKVGEAAQAAAKKSNELVETTKLNMAIKSEGEKIQKFYANIGKMVYENYAKKSNVDQEYVEVCESIGTCEQEIVKLKEMINVVKNLKVCISCGHEIDKSTVFCGGCGAKQEEPKVATGRVCPGCKAEVDADTAFCNSCGTKVE